MTDMMVDTETTGLDPTENGLIQIAAVKFNYATGDIGASFNKCMWTLPRRYWDDDTRGFWQGQNSQVYANIVSKQEDPHTVLNEFYRYSLDGAPKGGYRFWAKPTSFDFPLIQSHFKQVGLRMPFHYRFARDMNTHIAALRGKNNVEHVNLNWIANQHEGPAHDALSDVVCQLKQLFAAKSGDIYEVTPA